MKRIFFLLGLLLHSAMTHSVCSIKHTTTTTTTHKADSQTKPKCIPELNTVFALDFSSFTDEKDQNQMQTLNELVTNFIPSLPIGEGMRFSVMTIDSQSTNVYQTMTADKSKLRWVKNRLRLIEIKPKKTSLSNETGSVIADGFHVASLLHKDNHKTGVPKATIIFTTGNYETSQLKEITSKLLWLKSSSHVVTVKIEQKSTNDSKMTNIFSEIASCPKLSVDLSQLQETLNRIAKLNCS